MGWGWRRGWVEEKGRKRGRRGFGREREEEKRREREPRR